MTAVFMEPKVNGVYAQIDGHGCVYAQMDGHECKDAWSHTQVAIRPAHLYAQTPGITGMKSDSDFTLLIKPTPNAKLYSTDS